jgi:hypothetical protein
MQAPGSSTVALLVLLPLLAWRIYARFRRMIGRQRLSGVRPWITIAIFTTLVVLLALAALSRPERLVWLGGGLLLGAALARYGLQQTKFEPTREGLYYTPNAHLGIALSLLLVARIIFRAVQVYVIDPTVPHDPSDFARTPLTLAVFGVLAGYYIAYAIGLARWRAGAMSTH